jgi:hypothetical protein
MYNREDAASLIDGLIHSFFIIQPDQKARQIAKRDAAHGRIYLRKMRLFSRDEGSLCSEFADGDQVRWLSHWFAGVTWWGNESSSYLKRIMSDRKTTSACKSAACGIESGPIVQYKVWE